MKFAAICIAIMLLVVTTAGAVTSSRPKMRPYAGIGILLLPLSGNERSASLPLYEEPGLARQGSLTLNTIPTYDWIFGPSTTGAPLIVTGRKGPWLRVAYDDAGREGWLQQPRTDSFMPWNVFLKDHVSRLLPGLQKKYYQLYRHPDRSLLTPLTPQHFLKVLRLENDWALVLSDQNSLGWLRWCDEDGRLLLGVSSAPQAMQP